MTGWATAESAHRVWAEMAGEWQAFVGRRFNEDFHLLQELSASKAPDEVWNAWCRFWRKAAEDYGAEYAAAAKLAARLISDDHTNHAAASNVPVRGAQSKAA